MGSARLNPVSVVRKWVVDTVVRLLTKPLKTYTLTIPNDMANLKRHIRKGDVLLVEGNERISQCIKYLTQSSWSHSALYLGDEGLKRDPELRQRLLDEFGDEAKWLLIEALVEKGVVLTPLVRYSDFNIRICRPYGLSAADLRVVINEALAGVGRTYDLRNIFDLARYFLPVTLVPDSLRHRVLHFGSGEPTRAICSSLIAECFQKVKFPIRPRYEPADEAAAEHTALWNRIWRRQLALPGRFRRVPAGLVTPRDFDLSPYFEIVKFNVIENVRFDYRRIMWIEDELAAGSKTKESA